MSTTISVENVWVDWGDIPSWASSGIAVLALAVSVWSAALSWKSLRWERLSAEAATRSAEAAERANRLAETAVEQRIFLGNVSLGDLAHQMGDAPDKGDDEPRVSWAIERPSDNRYILRNTGTDTAEHVEVDASQISAITRNLPKAAVIRPGEGVDMLILGTFGHPVPNQLYVRWKGHPEWQAVPIS